MAQVQRNDPCPCGSGKKYKKCCMNVAGKSFIGKKLAGQNRYIYAALAVIFILSIFLRYYGFQKPHGLTFDEGLYANLLAPQLKENLANYSTQAAYHRMIAQEPGRYIPEYLDRPLFKHPPLYCYLIMLNYKMFGESDLAAVSVSIILGSLMVLAVFLLGAVLYDHRVGLISAFLLSIEPVHWVCSERIWMETTMSFFILLAILFFALGQKQKIFLLASGISAGLALLTKYPGALALWIIVTFALLADRALWKEKWFWALGGISLLMFAPWVAWNLKVYGSFQEIFISGHNLTKHWHDAVQLFARYKMPIMAVLIFSGGYLLMSRKIEELLSRGLSKPSGPKKKILIGVSLAMLIIISCAVPAIQSGVKEVFVWKKNIQVGWSNPFSSGPWYFYLTRLVEFSPFYLFSYAAFLLFLGKNKGDKLLIWSSVWILAAFILLGNYQSRYILPAVPFLVILAARFQVLVYDVFFAVRPISGQETNAKSRNAILKILFFGITAYFVLKTLRSGWLLAIGPDFGYF
jgi:4-amino-4-deoxy-L-arabinose transferase-like glycosyltransferase